LQIITPRTFRGTRDFLPGELLARRRILETIEEAYRRYGFQPLETPAIEYLEILTGKSEENDKLLYEIKRARGGEEETAESAIALRYDLTVPLARVVAQYPELPRPFKRYQIQPVWRADRPQPRQGRFREFVQCDADIVGTESLLADAELIALTSEILTSLRVPRFQIRFSSRKFLKALARYATGSDEYFPVFCRILDKLDKIGWDGVKEEWNRAGINGARAEKAIQEFINLNWERRQSFFDDKGQEFVDGFAAMHDLNFLTIYCISLGAGDHAVFDPTLARGLDYYTGPIFEAVLPELPHMGSLGGGGRYDGLVSTFSKTSVPATGISIGLDRLQSALTQLGLFKLIDSLSQVLICRHSHLFIEDNVKLGTRLRNLGLNVEVWYDDDRIGKQLSYADQHRIPVAIIRGEDESKLDSWTVKYLPDRTQTTRRDSEVEGFIQSLVEKHRLTVRDTNN